MATLVKQGSVFVGPGWTEVPIEEKTTLAHILYLPPSLYVKSTAAQLDCMGAGTGTFDGTHALAGIHGTISRRRLGVSTKIGTFLSLNNTTSAAVTVEYAVYRD
jgi:hypothetical protein